MNEKDKADLLDRYLRLSAKYSDLADRYVALADRYCEFKMNQSVRRPDDE